METRKEQIIEQAADIMMRLGIRSLTMDDLARHMGISKKTLYIYFKDKSDLVTNVLSGFLEKQSERISQVIKSESNPIEELFGIIQLVSQQLAKVHPSVLFDLEKYYPEAWKRFRHHQQTFIYNCISGNMERGIEGGLFRSDLNIPVITRIYISRIDMLFDHEIFPPEKFTFPQVYFEMIKYHIRGIATAKGLQYLDHKLEEFETP